MNDTVTGIRDRAIAAARERMQEQAVEVERRTAERKLRLLEEGTRHVYRALTDQWPPPGPLPTIEGGIGVHDIDVIDTNRATVTFDVDGMVLVYTEAPRALRLGGTCEGCGATLAYGTPLTGLVDLGMALEDQAANRPSYQHECHDPEAEWEGTLRVVGALDADPAHVLIDAMESYIAAAVAAAIEAKEDDRG